MTNPVLAPIRRVLDNTGASYRFIDCDEDKADTAIFCAHYGYALEDSVNTIVVKAKGGDVPYIACALLAHTRLDVNHTVRKRLGVRKVSFASAQQTREVTGMELGGVTAFGLPPELPLWVDAALLAREQLIFGSGERLSKIICDPDAIRLLPGAEIVQGLAMVRE
jgi:prolyl-tRNA editing enzyme YbaK/EbsC (Cys-tRNA(Pro) deacylase)